LLASLAIPPFTLDRSLLFDTMEEEEEAATPPPTTTIDRRRQQSEAAACSAIVMMMSLEQELVAGEEMGGPKVKKTRTARRFFDCQGSYRCIMRDYLDPNPLY
jgi:hypothetical protein